MKSVSNPIRSIGFESQFWDLIVHCEMRVLENDAGGIITQLIVMSSGLNISREILWGNTAHYIFFDELATSGHFMLRKFLTQFWCENNGWYQISNDSLSLSPFWNICLLLCNQSLDICANEVLAECQNPQVFATHSFFAKQSFFG